MMVPAAVVDASLDELATKKIRVKATTGGDGQVALGWYVLVS